MALFRKKADLISDRSRALNQEIADLEAQIKRLDSRLPREPDEPRLRSTAIPHGNHVPYPTEPSQPKLIAHEPIFEEVKQNRLMAREEGDAAAEHFNDLGVRKYDLAALLRRWRDHFQGPSTTNPKLVCYLAAGGIQGLRPLRYEKRVARNRFIALAAFLFLMLLGVILALVRHH